MQTNPHDAPCMTHIHPQARTTPKVRGEIRKAVGTQREIAAQFHATYPPCESGAVAMPCKTICKR
jgi:hypothetical protein